MNEQKVKLHLGCGMTKMHDYINIDLRKTECTDLVADCRELPYAENSVNEIISFHLIEHFDEPSAIALLKYWYSLLKIDGKLVIETPNLIGMVRRFIKEYDENTNIRPGYLYGCHSKKDRETIPNDNHLWGYSPESLKDYLEKVDFKNIKISEGTDYHARGYGIGFTIRAEAFK